MLHIPTYFHQSFKQICGIFAVSVRYIIGIMSYTLQNFIFSVLSQYRHIIFEFKRSDVPEGTTNQIMRYAEIYGQKSYDDLNFIYKNYISKKDGQVNMELVDAHREAFALEEPLKLEYFNHKQKMIIIGSSMDHKLAKTVDYWKSKGISIDFIPYRLFEIQGEYYLEYFAKPYDYVLNVGNVRGILFDTNLTYDTDAIWDMFKGNKISAYDERSRCVGYFNKNDYVFY